MTGVVPHEKTAPTLPGEIGETALLLPNRLTYAEWESVGLRLQGADDSLKWWIGDWLAYGERKYGETYAAAIEKTGYGVERLRQYKWVAERVPPENRYSGNGFSWSKHRAVGALDTLAQPKLLDDASPIHELFPRSPSRAGHEALCPDTAREAHATISPAVSTPRAASVVGDTQSGRGLNPIYDEANFPSYLRGQA